MKNSILTIMLLFPAFMVFSQPPEVDWVYQVKYEATDQMFDSVTRYTDVYVEMNSALVPDSALLALNVIDHASGNELYSKEYFYVPGLVHEQDVSRAGAIFKFYLGRYVIPPANLDITLSIETQGF